MKNNKSKLNGTYIIIAVIIGVAILGFGILNFVSKEKDRQLEQSKLQQGQTIEQSKIRANQESLQKCMQTAQSEFKDIQRLNSYPDPQPSYPDARTWNNGEIRNNIIKKLEDEKALCAKLYGTQ